MVGDTDKVPRAPPLVGREDALAALDRELERAVAGDFRVTLVTGTAGLGKTRLATEALQHFAARAVCLSARAYRWGATASFGLWLEALDRHLRRLDHDEARRLSGTPLGSLLTSVDPAAGAPGREPQRQELLEGLVDIFDRLSAEMPVIIVLDDIHLADMSSWEALRYLGRRLSGAPIGVIATARPGELQQHPIAGEVLVGLTEDDLLHRLSLEPLGRAHVARLAHEVLRAEAGSGSAFVMEPLVTWLSERSAGHPLYIIGLLRACLEEGTDPSSPYLKRIPELLQERVNVDLQRLNATARALLEVLAVVERRISASELHEITELALDDFGTALEALCTARLINEHADGAALAYEIAHPIVADAVYQQIGGTRRRTLHRTIARTLLRAGRLGSAAGHYARAVEPGDDEAIEALCNAMTQAEGRGLYQEALAALAALLEMLPADDPRWLRVLHAMTWQADWVLSHLAESDVATAIAAMERIEPHIAADDATARGTVQLHLAAFLSFGAGRMDAAEQACRAAIVNFEAAGEDERTLLARNELAWIRGCGHDLAEQATLAGEVLKSATGTGHARAAIYASGTQAYALGWLGRFGEADELYQRSIDMAIQANATYRAAWAMAQRGMTLALAGRLEDAFAWIETALGTDPLATEAVTLEYLAHCHWFAGRLADAISAVERTAVRRPMRGSLRRAWAAALAARVHAETGLRGRSESGLELAQATYDGRRILTWSCWAEWTRGFLLWHDDEPRRALEPLGRTLERLRSIGAAPCEALVLADTAQIAADAGDTAVAAAAADRLAAIARTVGGDLIPGLSRLAQAWSELAAERRDTAAAAGAAAAADLSTGGYRMYHGIALDVRGRALEPVDRAAAVEALSAAAGTFDACGAVWRRDTALARLARLGSRGRRAVAVHGPGALSDREHDVATLAARGHTAREIGERLFIGRRTVETHLANVYLKLGVASKRELIRRAEELSLKEPGP